MKCNINSTFYFQQNRRLTCSHHHKVDIFAFKQVKQWWKLTLVFFLLQNNRPLHYSKYRGFNKMSNLRFYIIKQQLRFTKSDIRSPGEYLNAAASPAQRETRAMHSGTCSITQRRQCGYENHIIWSIFTAIPLFFSFLRKKERRKKERKKKERKKERKKEKEKERITF